MTLDTEMREVVIYTDGSALGNPGPGGWAALLMWEGQEKEISKGYRRTTNNRMEMMAVLNALRCLKQRCKVLVYTDSKYVHDSIEKRWLAGWQRKGWVNSAKKPVKNRDLWEQIAAELPKQDVRLKWVKAHAGQPENERCDQLAKDAASGVMLEIDTGYENSL